MALVVADRIKETTTTTGTGTYTLAGASTGFEAFSVIGNSNTTYYCCTDGTDFEIGIGTYTASGTTLARTTILQSSNGDDKVNWGSGTRDIFVTQPAGKAVFLDASGHIIALDGRNLSSLNASEISSGTLSEDRLPSGGAGAATYGSTANGTKIDTITLDAKGRVTAVATGTTGDILGVTAGTGLSGGGTSGTVTLNLDFSELTDMTGDISGTTEFILQNGTTESRKAASEIGLSAFDNDAGFTTNTGDITGVTAGTGLSGGGASGSVTLNVSGLTVSELAANSLTTSAESFADNDTTLMTSAAINDRIESFGYSTTTGTVTSVGTTGTVNGITLTGTVTSSGNLTLGGTLGSITVSQLAGSALTTSSESFADNDTTLMTSAAINDRIESFGYITSADGGNAQTLDSLDSTSFLRSDAADTKTSGDLTFSDNVKVVFGTGSDLEIFHDGSNSYIKDESGTGALFIQTNQLRIRNAANTEEIFSALQNGAVELYHDNSKKIETTSTGATVTGQLVATSLDISGDVDVDGTLEADAMTLNGTAITSTATLSTGISNNNVPKFTSGVADNDFLRVAGTSIEGRSASEVLSDIGGISASSESTLTNKTLTTPVINGFSGTGDGTVTGTLNVVSTDGGVTADPQLVLYRNSASPADGDILANIDFTGNNSSGNSKVYGALQAKVTDVTDGTEDANFSFKVMSNGTLTNVMNLKGNGDSQILANNLALGQNVNLKFEGSSNNTNETTLTVVDPTADRTVTLPDASGTVLTTGNSDTPTTTTSSSDADFVLVDDGGTMKKITPANLGITSGSASKGFAVAMAIAL